jgi:hypothetical protein
MMKAIQILPEHFRKIQTGAALLGSFGTAALMIGAFSFPQQFLQSYLFGFLVWLSIPLGCLGLLMLHHMVSGRWGYVIQRILEAGALTLPLMALLFIPVLANLSKIYPWIVATEGKSVDSALVWSKYLNVPFFVVRYLLYFGLWSGTAFLLSHWSRKQDETGDPRYTIWLRRLCAPGLLLYALTVTFASVDWVMSLEPGWYSTIYGFIFIVGEVLAALAFSVVVLQRIAGNGLLSEILTTKHVHFMGNLLLTFVFLWAYVAYSQWIVIWSGNLPEENSWYLHRLAPGWNEIALGLIVLHFVVPFFLLLARSVKQSLRFLSYIAIGLLVMRVVDIYWLVMPAFHPEGLIVTWMDIAAPIAIGGIWTSAFVALLKKSSVLPVYDPRFVPTTAAAER